MESRWGYKTWEGERDEISNDVDFETEFEFQIENEIEVEIGIQTKRKNTCGK